MIVRAEIDVVVSVVGGLRGRTSRVRTLLDDKGVRLLGVSRLRPGLHRSGTSLIRQGGFGTSEVFSPSETVKRSGNQLLSGRRVIGQFSATRQALEQLSRQTKRTIKEGRRLSTNDFYTPTEIDALRMENELLAFEVRFLKTQLAEPERSSAQLKDQLTETRRRLEKVERFKAELQAQKADLQGQKADLQVQKADLRARVAELQAQKTHLQRRVAELQAQLAKGRVDGPLRRFLRRAR